MSGSNIWEKHQKFYSREGVIFTAYFGDQTGASVKKAGLELAVLTSKARLRGQKTLLLTDLTKLGDVNLAARKLGLTIMQELDYDRCAIFGCNYISAGLVKLMIIASGRGFKIRVFDNKKDAKNWLLSK